MAVAEQKAVAEPEPVAQASPTASGAAPSPVAELTTDDDDTTFQIKDEIAIKLEGEWCGAIISGILGDNKIQVLSMLRIFVPSFAFRLSRGSDLAAALTLKQRRSSLMHRKFIWRKNM
jgi:hypothetical protein